MGGISSSGLVSGIDYQSIINQLLAIESRPKVFAQQRIVQLQTQQAAYLDVNSSLLALRTAAASLRFNRVFDSAKASSSNAGVLSATAGPTAVPGAYSFLVNRLVTTDQKVSRGFTDRDTSGVGLTSLSVEIGGGQLTTETKLSNLNGGAGVQRGKILVSDRAGGSAEVDLSTAITVDDVLNRINAAAGVQVRASVDGDRLVLEDLSGGGGSLSVQDVFGSNTASSLGIEQTVGAASITGSRLNYLTSTSALASLNDGAGVAIRSTAAVDMRITSREGTVYSVRLGEIKNAQGEVTRTTATTIQDVIDYINEDTEGNVTAAIGADGVSLVLTDNTGGAGDLIVAEADAGRTTARDLGLLGSSSTGEIQTRRLLAGINSTLVSSLNGGSGLTGDELSITTRNGSVTNFTIDANGSISDLLKTINNSGAGVTARINSAGNGITLIDNTAGPGQLIVGGSAAESLGLDGSFTDGSARSGNLQTKWLGGATRLSTLNAGAGVGVGRFRIIDSSGAIAQIDVTSNMRTLDDLIGAINSRPLNVKARINDNGDGLLLEDSSGGAQAIRVEDLDGSVARRLNIAGTSSGTTPETNRLDGSFERTLTFNANDTLQQISDKLNSEGIGVTASIVNDGGGATPFRLALTSRSSGQIGRMTIDTQGVDLGLSTLTKGQDAVVFYGSADPASAIALTSSTNSLSSVVQGVTIDLNGASNTVVELVVARDTAAIETKIKEFVDSFNKVIETINKYDSYDAETNRRGTLLGDSSVSQIRSALFNAIQGTPLAVEGQFQRLSQAGVKIGSGAKLEFDSERFRQAFETDPQAVKDLFAAFGLQERQPTVLLADDDGNPLITTPNRDPLRPNKMGIAERIKDLADQFTNSIDGLLTRRKNTLGDQISLQNTRIRNFDSQLARKRQRLEAQFIGMEQAIASLQSQQAALGSVFGG